MLSGMIRRVWLRRAMAVLAAVLFVEGSAGDVFGRHLCPHHDAPIAAQLERSGSGHAGHEATGGAEQDPASGGEAHGCTCVGDCAGTPGVALPNASEEFIAEGKPAKSVASVRHEEASRRLPPYFLPWSNGPPILV